MKTKKLSLWWRIFQFHKHDWKYIGWLPIEIDISSPKLFLKDEIKNLQDNILVWKCKICERRYKSFEMNKNYDYLLLFRSIPEYRLRKGKPK